MCQESNWEDYWNEVREDMEEALDIDSKGRINPNRTPLLTSEEDLDSFLDGNRSFDEEE